MMKGNIFDIQHFSTHDGPGIRTTVFFKGCPLRCAWCHNPESQYSAPCVFFYPHLCMGCRRCEESCPVPSRVPLLKSGRGVEECGDCFRCVEECPVNALKKSGEEKSVEEIMEEVMKDNDFYDESGGGITLSGGEPLFQPSFCVALLKAAKERGLHTAIETSGYSSKEVLESVLQYTDYVYWDIKAVTEELYLKYTGVRFSIVKNNLFDALKKGIKMKLRFIFIPEIHSSYEYRVKHKAFLDALPKKVEWEIIPYHLLGNSKRTALGIERVEEFTEPSEEMVESFRRFLSAE